MVKTEEQVRQAPAARVERSRVPRNVAAVTLTCECWRGKLHPRFHSRSCPTQRQGQLPKTPHEVKSLSVFIPNASHHYWEKPTSLS